MPLLDDDRGRDKEKITFGYAKFFPLTLCPAVPFLKFSPHWFSADPF